MLSLVQVEIFENSSIHFTHIRFNYILSLKQRKILTLDISRIHKGDRSARDHEQAISIRHGHQIIGKQTSLSGSNWYYKRFRCFFVTDTY